MKTASEIEGDIYDMLRDSGLAQHLSGAVYREGYRPRGSTLEDAVVIFTAGLNGDIQEGVVTLNIYVPDIDPYGNGVLVKDGARIAQIEKLAQEWRDSLSTGRSNYLFTTDDETTIYSVSEDEINQHFVVVKLNYRYYEE